MSEDHEIRRIHIFAIIRFQIALKSFMFLAYIQPFSELTMEKIKLILRIWTKLSTHVRMRDRSIKILQYGSQMLLGFYAAQFSKVGVRRGPLFAHSHPIIQCTHYSLI